jgi:hypothetical protein
MVSWDTRPAERATSPTNRFLRCQRLRASFLPRAFAGSYPGHGSCGGALAEVFAESATLDRNRPPSNEPITTDWVEPTIRCRPFVRLTSFGGEGRALDGQIPTMSSASQEADGALKEPRSVSLPTRCRKNFRIRARRRNTMARNEPYGRILAGGGGLGASNH